MTWRRLGDCIKFNIKQTEKNYREQDGKNKNDKARFLDRRKGS